MIETLNIILIILTSFPIGYLLAYLCKEELIPGRRYFSLIAMISIFLCFVFLLVIDITQKYAVVFSLIYMGFISLVCLKLSYNKRFLGRKVY